MLFRSGDPSIFHGSLPLIAVPTDGMKKPSMTGPFGGDVRSTWPLAKPLTHPPFPPPPPVSYPLLGEQAHEQRCLGMSLCCFEGLLSQSALTSSNYHITNNANGTQPASNLLTLPVPFPIIDVSGISGTALGSLASFRKQPYIDLRSSTAGLF